MEENIKMNGDWYIPETNETIVGTLYVNKMQKRILLQLTKGAYNYVGISSKMLFLNLTQALETYHA